MLSEALAGLGGKLEAKDVQALAATLVIRMKTEQDSNALSELGRALASLSGKLEAKDVQPGAAALAARMQTEHLDLDSLATAWVSLEKVANAKHDIQQRVQVYVELLQLPLMVGAARKALLAGLEEMIGEKLDGDVWRFMDWATGTDEGRKLRLKFHK